MSQIRPASPVQPRHAQGARLVQCSLAGTILLLLAGCGQADDQASASDLPADVLYNRIEDARVLKDPQDADGPRLGSIAPADLPADLRQGRGCRLVQGERLLLLANAQGAVARIDGRILRLRIGGPLGPSGGFFVADGASVSIGRTVPAAGQELIAQGPATVSVGGAADRPIEKIEADWACS